MKFTLKLLLVLLPLALAASSASAATRRGIDRVPTRHAFARITSVGAGTDVECVTFSDANKSGNGIGSFAVQIENEDTTAANVLLFEVIPFGESVSRSELATPATDGTVSNVRRLAGGKTLAIGDIDAAGVCLQSGDVTNKVDAAVDWSY